MKRSFVDNKSNLEAKFAAQRLAFGPMMFQAARVLRESGSLEFLKKQGLDGATPEQLAQAVDLSLYAARILLEAGLAAEMVVLEEERFILTKVGYLVLRDPMTKVNMDFVHDVCYQPFFHFDEAIKTGTPAGLREFGPWKTVYEGLSKLPEKVQKSWFAFDHYYSDGVFAQVLPRVFASSPKRILDVGGNTGKWALECCRYDQDVEVTIVDLPGQLNKAMKNVEDADFSSRVSGTPLNILDQEAELPEQADVIWMSQFLDCFSEEQIVQILKKAHEAMGEHTRLFILETYWDHQRYEAARFSVINTSLYFTAVANGNSKMYHSDRMKACLSQAGLKIEEEFLEIGISHTLFSIRRA